MKTLHLSQFGLFTPGTLPDPQEKSILKAMKTGLIGDFALGSNAYILPCSLN